ncbi:MAG: DPP IV N-terminal domain-containing protein [Desulfobacula sp.]|jgi:Tol biopolymer transport system component
MNLVGYSWLLGFTVFFSSVSEGSESFNLSLEMPALQNIHQITFPSMGFEKAGEGYFSPDGQTVIFQAVPTGKEHYQIYTMKLEEGIPRLVSTGKGACTCAYFRPDGKKIIFASSHEDPYLNSADHFSNVSGYQRAHGEYVWDFTPYMNIYEANPDGTELKPLTTGPAYHAECAYSPDGSRIVYASNMDGSMNLYTMNADGSDTKQITYTTDCYNGGSFFSPDGHRVIFRADREKPHLLQIYAVSADGTQEQQLTSNQDVNWAPYWHPSGKIIAYTTSKHGHQHYEIYLLNIDTGSEFRLTHNPTFDGLSVFSNDGKKIMWTSKRGPDGTCQLFLADFQIPQELN